MIDVAGSETSAWAALRRRKLVQWALAYAAGAWVLLQAMSLIAGVYGWPESMLRILTGALFVGLPVALVLAWYHGERGEQRISSTELLILALPIPGHPRLFVGSNLQFSAPVSDAARLHWTNSGFWTSAIVDVLDFRWTFSPSYAG